MATTEQHALGERVEVWQGFGWFPGELASTGGPKGHAVKLDDGQVVTVDYDHIRYVERATRKERQ
jgi:hypothetical protein